MTKRFIVACMIAAFAATVTLVAPVSVQQAKAGNCSPHQHQEYVGGQKVCK
jgi:hypothetical protein